ncbi:ABC transporter permease [Pseudemcibacter aquimaris]|uniref:ABC transporter permease n=1 Tax=Pseudemcibacter aquimaris TaxID=2857064 RepID=UPI002010D181|nr:ABC transporter permease [Pseudemcibacter aquimaris]MCC3861280.1 ABC transporter permease [Pseudemcibacter aquimaris]WDU58054.1 ABC transporter permease [Pseudemcibacter aquimaris]
MMLFKNYITVAWRNIYNHKLFSAINILGLAIGLAACMMIALFVRDEVGYDKFWSKADNIYRMHQTFLPTARPPMEFSLAAGPIIHALKKDFPQIEHAARISGKRVTFTIDGNYFEETIGLVDAEFLNIFDLNALSGNINNALVDQSSIVLTKTLADKYFPNGDALGQSITVNADVFEREFRISAVVEDMPENTILGGDAFLPIVEEEWKSQEWMFDSWFSVNSFLYYTIRDGADINEIDAQMPTFIDRNFPEQGSGDKVSSFVELSSMPITDLHLQAPGTSEFTESGSLNTVLIFSAVAFLILLIASINFMNLSTARASQRAKEVSLRKVLGASRKNLVSQFIGESILLTLFALLLSMAIVEMSLPLYNETIGKDLSFDYASSDLLLVMLMAAAVGLMGGLYPAFILSGFRPAEVLKANKSSEGGASAKLRAALVIFQFAISITLFVSTAVVYGQMLYAKNIELGFDKERMIVIGNLYRDAAHNKQATLVNEYKRIPNVINVATSNDAPGVPTENNTGLRTPEMPAEDTQLIGNRTVGYDYFETYNIPLIAGRYYDINKNDERAEFSAIREGNGHVSSLVINETAVRTLGFSSAEEAVGKSLYRPFGNNDESFIMEYEIIGVVVDSHLDTLKKQIRPEMFDLTPTLAQYVTVKYTGDPMAVVDQLKQIWEQEIPSVPFDYNFATDNLENQYEQEQGEMAMFATFSGLAIFIACLGLYGLASFTAERRTKEIGIRKVMGASVFDIVKLLVWQFSKPVFIANAIAWPVAFYAMTVWLESFVYRIEFIFILGFCALAGVAALLIAWATVASNSFRVARANPIKALRYE